MSFTSDIPDSLTVTSSQTPVTTADRFDSIDALRGVALLGILAMNIVAFAWPYSVYGTPTLAPGYSWADLAIWMFQHFVFNTKMMTIFSMLFGAGVVLMSDRLSGRQTSFRRIYYRRITCLLIIGLIHAYLIWNGDILVIYALCGFALYPLRNRSSRTLIIIGVCLMAVAFPGWLGIRATIRYMDRIADQVDAELAAGLYQRGWRLDIYESREKIAKRDQIDTKDFQEDIDIHRSTYRQIVVQRAGDVFEFETSGFLLILWWQVGGRMVLGMGLMKLGVFSAQKSPRFYQTMIACGYGLGLPLILSEIAANWHYDFFKTNSLRYVTSGWCLINELSSPMIALGHVGVVMRLYQIRAWPRFLARLAAVGQMALSNYLFQSIVCTTLFYGYGFGLYGKIYRPGLALIVLALWSFQLWYSPIWLRQFRYGPAEWIWRSLTYGIRQPLVRIQRLE